MVRREGFEPPAFWSVGCLTHKSELFRLRFVLFATIRSADFPLFPSSPARFFRVLGQNWVKRSPANTVDLQSRIDLRLSEEVRAENCSDFSHVVQSCGRIVHEFYGTIYANKENGKLESNKRMWLYEKIHISILGNRVSVTYSKEV